VNRFLLPVAAAATLIILSACTADLDENCVTGPCQVLPSGSVASSAASTGVGGAGGAGGAGGSGPDCSGVPTTGQFPCDVFDVLVARCHLCHTDPVMGSAPFPLLQFEKTRELSGNLPIWQKMDTAINSGFMPFSAPDLVGVELETMNAWFAECAPPVPDGMGCESP
jgi:hypothetical protein